MAKVLNYRHSLATMNKELSVHNERLEILGGELDLYKLDKVGRRIRLICTRLDHATASSYINKLNGVG